MSLRATGRPPVGRSSRGVFSFFKNSSKCFYVILLIGLLDLVSHYLLALVYTILLGGSFGVSDTGAAVSFGLWGLATAAFCAVLSPLVDALGVKKTLACGLVLSTAGKGCLAFGHSKLLLWITVYVILPMGFALTNTGVLLNIERHAGMLGCRAFAHSLHSGLASLAMLCSGLLFDFVGVWVIESFSLWNEWLSPARTPLDDSAKLCVLLGGMASAVGLPLVLFLTTEASTDEHGSDRITLLEHGDQGQKFSTMGGAGSQCHHRCNGTEGGSATRPGWMAALQYVLACIVTMNLKQVSQQLSATFLKYHLRAFGCSSSVGVMYAAYPLAMISLGPIVRWGTSRLGHYDIIHVGTYVTALSPFLLAFFQTEWVSVASMALLGIGEAVWWPRWHEFLSSLIAPQWDGAPRIALATAPQLLAQLPAGILSGFLVSGWCPNNDECMGEPIAIDRLYGCQGKYIWETLHVRVTFFDSFWLPPYSGSFREFPFYGAGQHWQLSGAPLGGDIPPGAIGSGHLRLFFYFVAPPEASAKGGAVRFLCDEAQRWPRATKGFEDSRGFYRRGAGTCQND